MATNTNSQKSQKIKVTSLNHFSAAASFLERVDEVKNPFLRGVLGTSGIKNHCGQHALQLTSDISVSVEEVLSYANIKNGYISLV